MLYYAVVTTLRVILAFLIHRDENVTPDSRNSGIGERRNHSAHRLNAGKTRLIDSFLCALLLKSEH